MKKDLVSILKRGPKSKDELLHECGLKPRQFRNKVRELKNRGFLIGFNTEGNFWFLANAQELETTRIIRKAPRDYTFISTADWHLGSEYESLDCLEKLLLEAEKREIRHVFVAGDISDGNGKVYRGQLPHMKVFGADNMIDYLTENIPRVNGVEMIMIGGNHDESFIKEGVDVVQKVADNREDITHLGLYKGDIEINNAVFRLIHLSSANAYGISYPLQKYVRNIDTKAEKVDFIMAGHPHSFVMFQEQGIMCLQNYALQKATPFASRRGYRSQRGFNIIDTEIRDGRIQNVKMEAIKFDS